MLKYSKALTLLLAVALAGFVLGLVNLFQLRFSAGDIYPPYSSFRADPLGARAFYESLQRIPNLSARRFFQQSSKLGSGWQRALFITGTANAQLDFMPSSDYRALQDFMFSGGRVVLTLLPISGAQHSRSDGGNPFLPKSGKPASPKTKEKTSRRTDTNSEESAVESVSLFEKIDLTLTNASLLANNSGDTHPEMAEASEDFPDLARVISWHSAGYFSDLTNKWRAIYLWKNRPVIVERKFGAGSLVVATDSYFLSNEALRRERHAELLAWLMDNRREIIFDETHLGVEENPGIAGLMRRYNLEGVIAGLLLVAGLFVWKNSVPLVPPPPDDAFEGGAALVAGKESSAGFASLLRRSISPQDIVLTCFEEWKTACARQPRAAARLSAVEKIIAEEKARPPSSRRPVETYQSIRRALTQRD